MDGQYGLNAKAVAKATVSEITRPGMVVLQAQERNHGFSAAPLPAHYAPDAGHWRLLILPDPRNKLP